MTRTIELPNALECRNPILSLLNLVKLRTPDEKNKKKYFLYIFPEFWTSFKLIMIDIFSILLFPLLKSNNRDHTR